MSIVAFALVGCLKPSAMGVCEKVADTGVGTNCRSATPGGIGAAATERAEYDLPNNKTGQILVFPNESAYDRTVETFSQMAGVAGQHRYGNRKKLVFVQMNKDATEDAGKKVKSVIDSL
jgi:hypothetical protein